MAQSKANLVHLAQISVQENRQAMIEPNMSKRKREWAIYYVLMLWHVWLTWNN